MKTEKPCPPLPFNGEARRLTGQHGGLHPEKRSLPGRPDSALLYKSAISIMGTGKCTLVGAGPGDPELLTIKAVKAIQAATVLLVDDLVNDEIVTAYASPSARIVYVGKRGGCKSTPQAFIEKLMVMAAHEGENVVRLKGGDPFIFGRGGEEVAHLQASGVQVEVVNGITSGLAAVTALGVPLTHRDHAHGVIFVTGHARDGHSALHSPTLAAAAAQGLTLVIYMGIAKIETLQDGLLQALAPNTPVAVVQHASLPQQRMWTGRLAGLAAAVLQQGLGSPAVIIVGDVLKGMQQIVQKRAANRAA